MRKKNKNRNGPVKPHGNKETTMADLRAAFGLPEDTCADALHNPESIGGAFINPYNFVPHGSGCQRSSHQSGKLTGCIHCTLVPMTDLFIPNAAYAVEEQLKRGTHKYIEFFSYCAPAFKNKEEYICAEPPEKPVVPGSELRGMIRVMYEAFTDSCFSVMDDEKEYIKLTARVSNIKEPGMLKYENGQWALYRAVSYPIGRKQDQLDFGNGFIKFNGEDFSVNEPLGFKTEPINQRERVTELRCASPTDTAIGFLKIGEFFKDGRHAHIFKITGCKPLRRGGELTDAINQFNSIITDFYRNPKVNKLMRGGTPFSGQDIPRTAEEGDCRPVWYRYDKDTDRYYFSPACIGREMFYNHLGDILGTYAPCTGRDSLCEACTLFGMVGSKPGTSLGSHIRFSDAHFTGEKAEYAPPTHLKILGGPKLTSMAMYTKLNGDGRNCFWTYDDDGVSLNGRKFYYHHNSDYGTQEISQLNVTVRPIKADAGNPFEFDVFFEQISDTQLKKLLFVLSLFGNGSNHFHKLGMGKPLGMGSVKIVVDSVKLRSIDPESLEYSYGETQRFDDYFTQVLTLESAAQLFYATPEKTLQQLLDMTDFEFAEKVGLKVHYPLPYKNGGKVFDWFGNNIGSIKNPMFKQLLYPDGVLRYNGGNK